MSKTLILFAHPSLEKSRANKALIAAASKLPNVTINDLYEQYPNFQIDVPREKNLLLAHDTIVLQHPFYWYSTPSIIKEWFDRVLEYGWAYGKNGNALRGKTLRSVITTGGPQKAYCATGHNHYSVAELLRPVELTASLCGMNYIEPLVFYGALHKDQNALAAWAEQYRDWLNRD